MIDFPTIPKVPDDDTATGEGSARYEDLSQDGRVMLSALFSLGSPALWQNLIVKSALTRAMLKAGILSINSRIVAEGFKGPFGIVAPFSVKGGYQFAHTGRGDEVERILLNMWAELSAPRGRIHGPRPPGAGEVVSAGRFFIEQVLTRPFAPPGERKVLRIDVPGMAPVPEVRHPYREHGAIAALPEGAIPLEEAASADPTAMVFGTMHTDANRHVNTLVYPRLFEEAALRRFEAIGVRDVGLARFMEIGFRKPCFAGERVRIHLHAFTLGERRGAVGMFVGEGEGLEPGKSRCAVRMLFEP